ncbi:bifunctional adenosylcobinamide kinase/adenosylcobinamide-phosphate guanylyltransferase, partial [Clostridium cochlearium]
MGSGKVILVTGGSRSGKSSFAEELLKDEDDVLYIATSIVTDEEMEDRVKKHRERRNPLWETYEGYLDLDKAVENSNKKY